jgi:hypothetical protein
MFSDNTSLQSLMTDFLDIIYRFILIKNFNYRPNTTFRKLDSLSVIRCNLLCWAQSTEIFYCKDARNSFHLFVKLSHTASSVLFGEEVPGLFYGSTELSRETGPWKFKTDNHGKYTTLV